MILDDKVKTPTNNRNYKKFLSLGYKFNVGDELEKIINNNGATI
jgi:hypothetical protein